MTGRSPRTHLDTIFDDPNNDRASLEMNYNNFVKTINQDLKEIFNVAKCQLEAKKSEQDKYYKNTKIIDYKNGVLVWLREYRRNDKFSPFWTGPYRIVDRTGAVNYKIEDGRGGSIVVHCNKIKPFTSKKSHSLGSSKLGPNTSNPRNDFQFGIDGEDNLHKTQQSSMQPKRSRLPPKWLNDYVIS